MMRTGRIREPTDRTSGPTRMRPSAPSSWEIVTTPPAHATDQPWSSISQTNMNVTVTVCGIISSAEAREFATACTNLDTGWPVPRRWPPRGFPRRVDNRRPGWPLPPPCTPLPETSARRAELCSANSGITKAPKAIPSGWAVWRIPIAKPRLFGGNQPDTSRPPALLQLAAAMPPRNRNAPSPPANAPTRRRRPRPR